LQLADPASAPSSASASAPGRVCTHRIASSLFAVGQAGAIIAVSVVSNDRTAGIPSGAEAEAEAEAGGGPPVTPDRYL